MNGQYDVAHDLYEPWEDGGLPDALSPQQEDRPGLWVPFKVIDGLLPTGHTIACFLDEDRPMGPSWVCGAEVNGWAQRVRFRLSTPGGVWPLWPLPAHDIHYGGLHPLTLEERAPLAPEVVVSRPELLDLVPKLVDAHQLLDTLQYDTR